MVGGAAAGVGRRLRFRLHGCCSCLGHAFGFFICKFSYGTLRLQGWPWTALRKPSLHVDYSFSYSMLLDYYSIQYDTRPQHLGCRTSDVWNLTPATDCRTL